MAMQLLGSMEGVAGTAWGYSRLIFPWDTSRALNSENLGLGVLPLIFARSWIWPVGQTKRQAPQVRQVWKIPEGRHHLPLGAPAHHADGGGVLDFMAHPHAFAAQDAVALALGKLGSASPSSWAMTWRAGTSGHRDSSRSMTNLPGFLDFFGVGQDRDPSATG